MAAILIAALWLLFRSNEAAGGLLRRAVFGASLRHPVHQRRLPRAVRRRRRRRQHEPPGRLLGQRDVEGFFKTLKTELGDRFASRELARRELFAFIEGFYNTRRLHVLPRLQEPGRVRAAAGEVEAAA